MRRFLVVAALTAAILAPTSAAFAEDVTIGNCEHGRVTTIYNNNGTTGETRVIVCYP